MFFQNYYYISLKASCTFLYEAANEKKLGFKFQQENNSFVFSTMKHDFFGEIFQKN
jgi:hypothetical protein